MHSDKYAFDEDVMNASIERIRASRRRLQALPPKKEPARVKDANTGIVRVILDHVARSYGITVDELRGPCREPRFAHPRHLAMMLLRDNAGMSQTLIGDVFHRSQHATMHGIHQAERRVANDPRMRGVATLCPFPLDIAGTMQTEEGEPDAKLVA